MRWPDVCHICESPRPGSFSALMEMYEQNYIRLRCLCPDIRQLQGHHVSRIDGAHDLHLIVLEQARHTTTFKLTYQMADGALRPDVTLRIYHDALQAEVLSRRCNLNGRLMQTQRSPTAAALACRWKINRFLYKWLNYCGRQGHGFRDPVVRDCGCELCEA